MQSCSRFDLAVLQEVAYDPPIRTDRLNLPDADTQARRKALRRLASYGWTTVEMFYTDAPIYQITGTGRIVLDSFRREHPLASPFVFYRS